MLTVRDLLESEGIFEEVGIRSPATPCPAWNYTLHSVKNAKYVIDFTGADAIMIARGAQGRPWIFREIKYFLETGKRLAPIQNDELSLLILEHIQAIHGFYGEQQGVRIARKHIKWYVKKTANRALISTLMQTDTAQQQLALLATFVSDLDNNRAA